MVILNGTPVSARPPDGPASNLLPLLPERYVLAVGSLIPRKAYDVLVKAIGLARVRGPHLDLVVVGDGPKASRLATLAKALNVEDQVFFAGDLPHAEALRFYTRAKFFVHTAREEAFGLVILEAMSFAKAVIAPRVGGIPQFVRDGETGLLVNPDDPAALAKAMIRLDRDDLLLVSLAGRGYESTTKEHSWDDVVDAYQATCDEVLRGSDHIRPAVETPPLPR